MPKLWSATIATHRAVVRDAILDATVDLVSERGLRAVTMAEIAERAGIGRATLYRYFRDAESVLRAWHDREIGRHVAEIAAAAGGPGTARARLVAVLRGFTAGAHGRRAGHDAEMAMFFHRDEQVAAARVRVRRLLEEVLAEAAAAGAVRDDVAPGELAAFCLAALSAAGDLPSDALPRLEALILAGLGVGPDAATQADRRRGAR